jgi:heat shock protein HslJ
VAEQATNPETNETYLQDTQAMLNATSDHDWNPDLSQLDAMVESLTFPTAVEDEVALPVPGEGETAGIVLAPAGVNVRVGPSAGYPSLGVAPFGTSGILIGKSEDDQWWVVEVPVSELAPEGHGWVAAEFVLATDAEELPVIAGPTKLETLQLVTWDWFALAEPAGMTAVEDSGRYTIPFDDEGMAEIKADCNNVTAEYTADEDSISIELGISTMAACPPDSLDQLFLASLGQAAIYRYEDGNLFLDLDEGAGIMRFKVLDE